MGFTIQNTASETEIQLAADEIKVPGKCSYECTMNCKPDEQMPLAHNSALLRSHWKENYLAGQQQVEDTPIINVTKIELTKGFLVPIFPLQPGHYIQTKKSFSSSEFCLYSI